MDLHTIITFLPLLYLVIGSREYHQKNIRNTIRSSRNGELTDGIVFRTTRRDDPVLWFNREHPLFEYTGQFMIGDEQFITGRIRKRRSDERFSVLLEDPRVDQLRKSPEISWVSQERGYIRVKRAVDTELNDLWHLNGEVLPSMNVKEVWNSGYNGSGIVVAVLDDGLEYDHPDLAENCNTERDIDIFGFDRDPYPPTDSSHGTEVAGFIAGVRGNDICTVGIAYSSTLIGVRILGSLALTDSQEASALNHQLSYVDIYSNSWGPEEEVGFEKPGPITELALKTGVTLGRNGKGAIYIWAAGNGGLQDNCNADGYASSIYTTAITSVAIGDNAWYSEVCSAVLASAYGGSDEDRFLTTTTTYSNCTSDGIQGTSYAAPIASGIVALTLEANPDLTWRDIQHLIVLTSSLESFNDTYSDYTINGAGKEYSQVLGFGLMNAKAMVEQALTWTTVPEQRNYSTSNNTPSISTSGTEYGSDYITINSDDCSILYLEHVTVDIMFSYTLDRGATELYLTSPSGSKSHLLHLRFQDATEFSSAGSLSWTYMSVHFWGESPVGNWTLEVGSYSGWSVVTLDSWSLTFYGTETNPIPDATSTTETLTSAETVTTATEPVTPTMEPVTTTTEPVTTTTEPVTTTTELVATSTPTEPATSTAMKPVTTLTETVVNSTESVTTSTSTELVTTSTSSGPVTTSTSTEPVTSTSTEPVTTSTSSGLVTTSTSSEPVTTKTEPITTSTSFGSVTTSISTEQPTTTEPVTTKAEPVTTSTTETLTTTPSTTAATTTRRTSGGISESSKDVIFISVTVAAVIITIQVLLYLRFIKGPSKSKGRDNTLRRDSEPKIYSRQYSVPNYPYSAPNYPHSTPIYPYSGKHVKPVFTSTASNNFPYYSGNNWYEI